jgi:hypothetical protein
VVLGGGGEWVFHVSSTRWIPGRRRAI